MALENHPPRKDICKKLKDLEFHYSCGAYKDKNGSYDTVLHYFISNQNYSICDWLLNDFGFDINNPRLKPVDSGVGDLKYYSKYDGRRNRDVICFLDPLELAIDLCCKSVMKVWRKDRYNMPTLDLSQKEDKVHVLKWINLFLKNSCTMSFENLDKIICSTYGVDLLNTIQATYKFTFDVDLYLVNALKQGHLELFSWLLTNSNIESKKIKHYISYQGQTLFDI
eukprot:UN30096